MQWVRLRESRRLVFIKECEFEELEEELVDEGNKWLRTIKGTKLQVELQKIDQQGRMPVLTCMLDDQLIRLVFGLLYLPYKRRYFWFLGYEMIRRLAQSSLVIIVRMLGRDFDTMYSLLIAVFSVVFHSYLRPFNCDEDNVLQLAMLSNQVLVVMMLLMQEYIVSDSESTGFGVGLLLIQLTLLVVVVVMLARLYGPVLWVLLKSLIIPVLRSKLGTRLSVAGSALQSLVSFRVPSEEEEELEEADSQAERRPEESLPGHPQQGSFDKERSAEENASELHRHAAIPAKGGAPDCGPPLPE
ncbi:hypothetical protein CYMTET_36297 [Cymbomonas tetramitiformis]|uniref:TRP C-terminal domain-containing protein n=1 Tax=Cymbomonas tetramitiformis TaxID=36881 RepID=A0AAE0CG92_9CHLO|nr:hypothetical protein CYMTET_36297 [Cymbomonas tetramitiformis]